MNFELFIAKKIIRSNTPNSKGTRPIINIATASISLGIAVMILSLAIVTGFQNQIRNKVIGFGSHIQITSYGINNSVESSPISKKQQFYPHLDTVQGVKHIQYYATKAGILRTENDIHGVVLKGVGIDFDWSFFNQKMIAGKTIQLSDSAKSNGIIISKTIAKQLKLNVGDKATAHFVQDPPRARRFTVNGIYESGMEKFDNSIILVDIQHIQKLNNWTKDQVSGFEVILDNYSQLENMDEIIYNHIGYELRTSKITERNQEIFNWLKLLDKNVYIILILMVLVAGINMISALLILILERTNMVGMLKALGAEDWSIQKIFLYNAAYLVGKGLLFGNILGLGLCFLQQQFNLIKLPRESYYIDAVPIKLEIFNTLLINFSTFGLCLIMLLIPSYIVTKISPVKSIKFN
ncbi:MAG: ABC transporter permease [Flavobacteriales bacterium]|nr:ABC transporter permease [Flavobacteriales bacterium]